MLKNQWLDSVSLATLPGVGTALAAQLGHLGLQTVQDLLFHLPLRYQDRTCCTPIDQLLSGMQACVEGEIVRTEVVAGRRRMMLSLISDATGTLTLRFFHFNIGMQKRLMVGRRIQVYGEIHQGINGLEIIHPECHLLDEASQKMALESTLTPVYPTTKGVKQTTWRRLIDQALKLLDLCTVTELLPPALFQEAITISLAQALQILHRPSPNRVSGALQQQIDSARQRLVLEELLAHQLSLLAVRSGVQCHCAWSFPVAVHLKQQLLAALPFQPTSAQFRVVAEIEADLARRVPMMRLVQGDVGSGKTLVALLAALNVIDHGKQVVLMAPTEVLAEQHAETFHLWLKPLGFKIGRLMGHLSGKKRRALLDDIAQQQIMIIIGTHALFQRDVVFSGLGLVIIDEQHRFGVHQRLALWEKGKHQGHYPHQLVMTATPIPRTLAMTAYADLESSVIDQLPPGRQPINTVVLPDHRRHEVIQRVQKACEAGKQAYWVCPLVEESTLLAARAAENAAVDLREQLPTIKIGLLHGRMKSVEKQATLQAFKTGHLQLLVATTIIEIGVDVPNASLMIIEDPSRFGLAQLHQLRGRVGRGAVASHCVLLYKAPLSQQAKRRLAVLRESNDGFFIAQRDLEIRGPGELLGTRQTGDALFRFADLLRDQSLIPKVQQLARQLHQNYPEHARALIERWLPERFRYTNA